MMVEDNEYNFFDLMKEDRRIKGLEPPQLEALPPAPELGDQ
jgi:hypothetical protein